jgi:hypothetical protein
MPQRSGSTPQLVQQQGREQQQEQQACDDTEVPSLVVFDLDACLWLPEMYQLDHPPGEWDDTAAGVRAGKQVVRLFPGALHAFKALAEEPRLRHTKVAFASSTTRPSFADAVMQAYRLHDGSLLASRVTVAEMYPIHHKKVRHVQRHRDFSPPAARLTPDPSTLRRISARSGTRRA